MDEPPITLDEVTDELRSTEQQLDSLLDAVITMAPSFLPDHRDDLVAEGTALRRTVRLARAWLAEDDA
jgi:hypothetical protein